MFLMYLEGCQISEEAEIFFISLENYTMTIYKSCTGLDLGSVINNPNHGQTSEVVTFLSEIIEGYVIILTKAVVRLIIEQKLIMF